MAEECRNELSDAQIKEFVAFTNSTLDEARRIVLSMMEETFSKDTKPDKSFVTDVDLAVEKMIRAAVQERYPDHGVLGEELPTIAPDADFRWITDPVDGTQNLVHRLPTFGCILGLHYKGRPVAGAIDHPLLNLRYSAGFGLGAWENETRVTINDDGGELLDTNEIVALATRAMFERTGEGALFDRFMQSHDSTRVFYDCFSTTRVVAGQVGALAEFNVRIWDLAATEILVTEAGGVYEEVRVTPQPEGKEALRSVLIGKPSVVNAIRSQFVER